MDYQILLYYQYVRIIDHETFAKEHLQFCSSLGLRGRIIVSSEGLNGTVSGTVEATNAYMDHMHRDPRFSDMVFKIDQAEQHAFKKMFVRTKKEIVNLSLEKDINPKVLTGKRLKPREFYEYLKRDDVIVIDGRNDYEFDIGHFRKAVRPSVKAFRQFPEWIREHKDEFQGKKILTYCTGGIRCEKLSGLFLREGFEDVYQLDGGIVTYGKDPEAQGQLFDGKCYVFDERISVPINQVEDIVVGRCTHCNTPTDRYINCGYLDCHLQHICCEKCDEEFHGFCSYQCEQEAYERNRVDPLMKAKQK
jgi:UPF0176 protein